MFDVPLPEFIARANRYVANPVIRTFAGRIPPCKGVVAFAASLAECQNELRSVLEDWILVGIKLGHRLPVLGDIDLNREPEREPVDAL